MAPVLTWLLIDSHWQFLHSDIPGSLRDCDLVLHGLLLWFCWSIHYIFFGSIDVFLCLFGSINTFLCLFEFPLCHLISPILGAGWLLVWTHSLALCWRTCWHCFLTFTQTLVSCSSLSSPKHLWKEVLCDYPAVKGVGYWEVEGVHAGVAVLNPEYQDAHNQENQSYVSTSCGFGLTHWSEIRKVQGYCYLCALGRGSNLLLPPWFVSKA